MENKLGITKGEYFVTTSKLNKKSYLQVKKENLEEIVVAEFLDSKYTYEDLVSSNALNTFLKCGKLPSQLLQENEEMKVMLEKVNLYVNEISKTNNFKFISDVLCSKEIEQLLTKINQ